MRKCIQCGGEYDPELFGVVIDQPGWRDTPISSYLCRECAEKDEGVLKIQSLHRKARDG